MSYIPNCGDFNGPNRKHTRSGVPVSHSPTGAVLGPAATWQGHAAHAASPPRGTQDPASASPHAQRGPWWDGASRRSSPSLGHPFPQSHKLSSRDRRGHGEKDANAQWTCPPDPWFGAFPPMQGLGKGATPRQGSPRSSPASPRRAAACLFSKARRPSGDAPLCRRSGVPSVIVTARAAPGKGHLGCTSLPLSHLCSCQISSLS